MHKNVACKYGGPSLLSRQAGVKDMEDRMNEYMEKELEKATTTIKKLMESLDVANEKLQRFEDLKQHLLTTAVEEPNDEMSSVALSYARRIAAILKPTPGNNDQA